MDKTRRRKTFKKLSDKDREGHCNEFCRNTDQDTTNFLTGQNITKGNAVHSHLRVLCDCEKVSQKPTRTVNPDTSDTTKRQNKKEKQKQIPLSVQTNIIRHLDQIDSSLVISIAQLAQVYDDSEYTMYGKKDIQNLNVRQLLMMRTRTPTEKAKQNTLNMMKFLEKTIVSVPQTASHYVAFELIRTSLFLLQDPKLPWVVGPVAIFVSMLAVYLLDELGDAAQRGIRKSWQNWLSYNSWREWLSGGTAKGSLQERDKTGFTDIILRDKNGMATAHLEQVDEHLDILLALHVQDSYPKKEYKDVINKAEEALHVKWDHLTVPEQVLWIASAQTGKEKHPPTLDETKLKCDLLQSSQRDCGDVIVSNLIANDDAQSYELAARLLAARNYGRRSSV